MWIRRVAQDSLWERGSEIFACNFADFWAEQLRKFGVSYCTRLPTQYCPWTHGLGYLSRVPLYLFCASRVLRLAARKSQGDHVRFPSRLPQLLITSLYLFQEKRRPHKVHYFFCGTVGPANCRLGLFSGQESLCMSCSLNCAAFHLPYCAASFYLWLNFTSHSATAVFARAYSDIGGYHRVRSAASAFRKHLQMIFLIYTILQWRNSEGSS